MMGCNLHLGTSSLIGRTRCPLSFASDQQKMFYTFGAPPSVDTPLSTHTSPVHTGKVEVIKLYALLPPLKLKPLPQLSMAALPCRDDATTAGILEESYYSEGARECPSCWTTASPMSRSFTTCVLTCSRAPLVVCARVLVCFRGTMNDNNTRSTN